METVKCPPTPSGKDRYPNKAAANRRLNIIWRNAVRGNQRASKMPCRAYRCKVCKGYHLTSQPKAGKPRKR